MRDEHMVIREARYLSGNDIGKTVTLDGVKGEIVHLDFDELGVDIHILCRGYHYMFKNELVKIEGKKSNANQTTE